MLIQAKNLHIKCFSSDEKHYWHNIINYVLNAGSGNA